MHAKAVEERGKLHADDPAADDDERSRQLFAFQSLAAGPIGRFRQAWDGRDDGFRAGAEQQVLGFIDRIAAQDGNRAVRVFALNLGLGVYDFDTGLFHLHADAGSQFLDNFILASNDFGQIERRILRADTVLGGTLDLVQNFGGIQQRLCRDAAFVQTNAAQSSLLKQNRGQATARSLFSRSITGGTAADDSNLEFHGIVVIII